MTVRAVWNGVVLAESDDTVVVDGNHYFPESALRQEYFTPSPTKSLCPWKGIASYYSVTVYGATNADAAWTYRHPLPSARKLKNGSRSPTTSKSLHTDQPAASAFERLLLPSPVPLLDRCRVEAPVWREIAPDHQVACQRADELTLTSGDLVDHRCAAMS
ncbi:DUF427 domain-containing protein [Kribbella lupini]|uniref:DUF427 domain-containing protein n=1 Tax=Kribbella lupini TaxID=291602 RepID=A0ABP4LG38_9ACTN